MMKWTRALCGLVALLWGSVGCSDPADPLADGGLDAAPDGPADGPIGDGDATVADVALDAGEDATEDVGVDVDADAPNEADAGAPPDAPPDTLTEDALPDGPTGPNICGDGWRDPLTEECDDGVDPISQHDRACTSSCTVIDRLASNSLIARERRLGAGRHPAAGSHSGHAAVMIELGSDAGNEAQLVVHTFSSVGVRLGSASVVGVPFDADPVVAALPSGEFVIAFSGFLADGDGLDIRLVRVSADGSSSLELNPANGIKDFSQRAPDILWTGSELVVAWEDESTIPRSICTRSFSQQLQPGTQNCICDVLPLSRVSLASLQGQLVTGWRVDDSITSTYQVRFATDTWSSPPVDSPWFDETIALAEMDSDTMVAVYCDGTGQMLGTVLNAQGIELGVPADLNVGSGPRFRPTLASTPDGIYLAWREPAIEPGPGEPWDPVLDELWLQKLTWNGSTLDLSSEPIPLPHDFAHQHGDQARPALATVPYWPSGAILAVWDDLTSTSYGASSDHGDVVLELIPTPILRTSLAY